MYSLRTGPKGPAAIVRGVLFYSHSHRYFLEENLFCVRDPKLSIRGLPINFQPSSISVCRWFGVFTLNPGVLVLIKKNLRVHQVHTEAGAEAFVSLVVRKSLSWKRVNNTEAVLKRHKRNHKAPALSLICAKGFSLKKGRVHFFL